MASSVVSDNFETSTGAIPNMGGTDVTTRLCSAWVNFNGTGTVAIRDSYNVSSIIDNGTGSYTVNITAATTATACSVMSGMTSTTSPAQGGSFVASTTTVKVLCGTNTTAAADWQYVGIAVFSN